MVDTLDPAAIHAAIVASTDVIVIAKDLDGTVVAWNPAAEAALGWSEAEMVGRSIRTIIPADLQYQEDAILARIRGGQRTERIETVRLHKDGRLVPLAFVVSPVLDGDGRVVGASKLARDITRERELSRQEHLLRDMIDSISQLAWMTDPQGQVTWLNRRWYEYTGADASKIAWDNRSVVHPDFAQIVRERFFDAVQRGEDWEDTFPLRAADGTYRWFLSRAAPLRDEDGQIVCWFGTNTDVTEQREAEKRVELLLMEVNHRSKNMLALIQALARRSAQAGGDFVARIEARIRSLAANQDLLVSRHWSAVPMPELIAAQLAFLGETADQFEQEGEDLAVVPAAAETIGLALHELATNALKYGALSIPEGRVSIRWAREGDRFTMRWTERGGPPVASAPTRTGFGTRLIADVPRGKLGAEVTIAYAPEGLRWELVAPAKDVVA